MSRPVNLLMTTLTCSLVLGAGCDFAGDRSLGRVEGIQAGGRGPAAGAGGSSGSNEVAILSFAGRTTLVSSDASNAVPCQAEGDRSGCPSGQYCAFGLDCGGPQAPRIGACQPLPETCPTPNGFERVCGCDGQFYDSRCLAEHQGVSISDLSRCEPMPCLDNVACREFLFSCIDTFGLVIKGVLCNEGRCACGGTETVLL